MKIILLNDVKSLGNHRKRRRTSPTATREISFSAKGLAAEASSGALSMLEQQRHAKIAAATRKLWPTPRLWRSSSKG